MYQIPLKSKHPLSYAKTLYCILRQGRFNAIHVHSNTTSFYPLLIAMFSGTSIRIAHAHTAMVPQNRIGQIKRFMAVVLIPIVATKLVACSAEAASAIFGEKIRESGKLLVLHNAIDADDFAFDCSKRFRIRQALHVEHEFILGCVGNLGIEKNHVYALKVLNEIKKTNAKCCMLLIGDGPLGQTLRNEARSLGIENEVHFLGRRTDVKDLLQAMDVFLMPSLYEGFPIAALEAAASGLPLFLSDNITKEFSFYSRCKYLSIMADPKIWAQEVLRVDRNVDRKKAVVEVKRAGYDLTTNIRAFEALYK
jgi:glycosyltransferase EpsF